MRVQTSDLILEFIKDKEFVPEKEIKETISSENEVSSDSVRVALVRLEKTGNIEKKFEGRVKLFKYLADVSKERKPDAKMYVKDLILKLLVGKTLTMEQVVDKVLKKFPDTSKGNIKTILSRESAKGTVIKLDEQPYQYTIKE